MKQINSLDADMHIKIFFVNNVHSVRPSLTEWINLVKYYGKQKVITKYQRCIWNFKMTEP